MTILSHKLQRRSLCHLLSSLIQVTCGLSALVAEMSPSRGEATPRIQVPQDELPVFPKKTLIAIVVLTVIITVNMNYGWYKDRQALDIPPLDKEYALYRVSKPACRIRASFPHSSKCECTGCAAHVEDIMVLFKTWSQVRHARFSSGWQCLLVVQ
jgi:hypothetical protein